MSQEFPPSQRRESISQSSETSQTAADYISSQLQLEADAREVLPYQFDTCTYPLGPLRQSVFSCQTCNPPPSDPSAPYKPAGICYACSISCHGEHELVELFTMRNFTCDCGTTRLPTSSTCSLRVNTQTGTKGGVHSETPAATNVYNHNFRNRFCGCGELYDPRTEKGTMFQCLGLGTTKQGGCGEDWWHPECNMGLPRNWYQDVKSNNIEKKSKEQAPLTDITSTVVGSARTHASGPLDAIVEEGDSRTSNETEEIKEEEHPVPPGFPNEDDFEHLLCYKCIDAFPWIKRYANCPGFICVRADGASSGTGEIKSSETETPALVPNGKQQPDSQSSLKRKADDVDDDLVPELKKSKSDDVITSETPPAPACKLDTLAASPNHRVTLFLKEEFRDHLCHCPKCFPLLTPHPQLLDEEAVYEPPVSEDGSSHDGSGSVGSRSLLDRGEAALSNMDRVRAIEGVMAYNKLRDNLKDFLKPFAESGQAVGAEDIRKHFEKLRGDQEGIRQAALARAEREGDDGDPRKEQGGY